MARLAIDKDFLDDYSRLPKPIQNSVKTAIDKFAEHVHAGLHLEKITRCKDDRIRTIRIPVLVLPPSLFEHSAAELSVDDSAQLGEDRRQPDHIA